MAKSESSSRIVTSVVAVISAAALAVSLIAAGFAACAVPDVSTKALASVYSTDGASPFTKDELVAAAVQTKHYTIDDNDKAAAYATIAAINAQEALAGTAGKGAPKIDATANYAAGELSGEQVAALETAFDAASERYVLTPDAVSHLDDVFGVVQAAKWWLLAAVVAACVGCTATAFRGGKRLLGCACRCGRFRFGGVRVARGVGCYRFRRLLRAIPLAVLRGRHMDFQLGFFAHLHVPA